MNTAHFASTFALFGLIWTIQCVHYPSFRFITANHFPGFHKAHTRRISRIVIPLMTIELVTITTLTITTKSHPNLYLLLMTLLVWLSTFTLQVPCHRRLETGKDEAIIDRLIKTNWIRTALWSGKAGYLCLLQLSTGVV